MNVGRYYLFNLFYLNQSIYYYVNNATHANRISQENIPGHFFALRFQKSVDESFLFLR